MEQILTQYPFSGYLESRIGGRPDNQDSFGYVETPDGLLVIVCDGMGGGPGGKTASSLAVEVIKQSVLESSNLHQSRKEALEVAIERAHGALLRKMQEVPALRGMGTTIAALYINYDSAVIVHIGDSRVYKLRDGFKVFRTQDHSMVGDMVRGGTLTEEQARLSAQANIITRAIGIEGKCIPVFEEIPFEKGDRFVLCSDGIWGAMPEPQLIKNLSERRSLANIVESLSNKVDSLGHDKGNHHDNLTLVMVDTKNDSKLKEKMNRKAKMIIGAIGFLLIVSLIFNMVQSCSKGKNESYESKIEKMEAAIQNKDAKILELRDSVKLLKKDQPSKKTNTWKDHVNQDTERKQTGGQNFNSEENSVKESQKKEDNKEAPVSSIGINSSDYKEDLNIILKMMINLCNIQRPNIEDCKKSVVKMQAEIEDKLNNLKEKYPDKKEKLNDLQIKEELDKYVGQDPGTNKWGLTTKWQKEVTTKIDEAKKLLK